MKYKLLLTLFSVLFLSIFSMNGQTMCGQLFTDEQGPNANYANNSDYTITICPTNPGEMVTVSFTSFNIETNFDGLYIYDGTSTAAQQISSGNPASNIPGGLAGAFWGSTNPGNFTATNTSGCLTFRFRSDASVTQAGWIANVICSPASACHTPNNLFATDFTGTTATFGWVESGNATQWEVIVLPAGSPAPTSTSTGTLTTTNPYTITGLVPGIVYMAYVRAVCDINNQTSNWSNPVTTVTSNTGCTPPNNLTVTSITNSGATLNWAINPNATQWEVLVLPANGGLPTPN